MPPSPMIRVSVPVERTLHRRRVLLAALLVSALVSFVLAVVIQQSTLWGLHVTADGLLVLYLAVLIHVRNTAAEHDMTRRGLGL